MAKIFPFRAYRYNPARVNPQDVVTQPYDKISPKMQDKYYEASPYNLVRIILGKPNVGDNEQDNVYSRAARHLGAWQSSGVLTRDDAPSLYLYTQTFTVPDGSGRTAERRGFIAVGQLEEYNAQVVFRHEQTLSKPKADRLNLLQATQSHFGQIFMLYSDPAAEIERVLEQDSAPDVEVRDEYDVVHRLWKVSDPKILAAVQSKMEDKNLIIADGHHRYETALNYRNACRNAAAQGSEAPYERVMMTFVNMDSPGLVILPTHRVVFGLENFSIATTLDKLRKDFDVEELGPATSIKSDLKKLEDAGVDRTALLAVTKDKAYLLRGRPESHAKALPGLSAKQSALDVVQLHKVVLEQTLGMSEEDIRNQKNLKYLRDAQEAVDEVRSGGADIAFLMNPVSMEEVRDIAFAGEVLPQKSTDFFPKLLSGLTIYSLRDAVASAEHEQAEEFAKTRG